MNEELGGRSEYLVMSSAPLGSTACLKSSHLQDVMGTVWTPPGSNLRQLPWTEGSLSSEDYLPGIPHKASTIMDLFVLELSFLHS